MSKAVIAFNRAAPRIQDSLTLLNRATTRQRELRLLAFARACGHFLSDYAAIAPRARVGTVNRHAAEIANMAIDATAALLEEPARLARPSTRFIVACDVLNSALQSFTAELSDNPGFTRLWWTAHSQLSRYEPQLVKDQTVRILSRLPSSEAAPTAPLRQFVKPKVRQLPRLMPQSA